MMLEDPYAYAEAAMQEPPLPNFVLEPIYPEFMPPEDDVLPAKEQSLPVVVHPLLTHQDPEEDDDEDPADYPANHDDDDDEEPSEDEANEEDEEQDEDDDDEEEEHPASAYSIPPLPARTPIPFLSEIEVDKLLTIPTPPPSPLTSYSSPLPYIPSSSLPTSPTNAGAPLGYRAGYDPTESRTQMVALQSQQRPAKDPTHPDVPKEIEFKEPYTPSYNPPGIVYEDLDKQKVLDFRLDYNKEMPKRKWMAIDQKRSGLMIELIDKQLREREVIKNLERLVGARELEMDYKLMTLDLHLNDIEDMLLLTVQHKLFHLDGSDIVDFIVALRMFTRSLILKRHVEDL
nr:hypothetical protein [Tanacetum cinerariifolium]